jgi:hypothetical protein
MDYFVDSSDHKALVEDIISELVSAVSAKEGISFPDGSIARLAAIPMSWPTFHAALRNLSGGINTRL